MLYTPHGVIPITYHQCYTDISSGAVLSLLVEFPFSGEVDPKLVLQGTDNLDEHVFNDYD